MRQLKLNITTITDNSPAYVIAEISGNHCGSVNTCCELIKVAKQCGADAVKLVKRDNKSHYTKALYNSPYNNPNSYGATYGEHREALEFGYEDYVTIQGYAREIDIDFFATAFDIPSANFLMRLNVPAIKIASGSLTNIELIQNCTGFNKPLIISTGGASYRDINRVYKLLNSKYPFAFLHCIASYPNQSMEINLNAIKIMKKLYPDIIIGWSDHYNGICMAEGAYMSGARIIEKHFTLNHTWKGTDHALSLEPQGMERLCRDLKRLHEAQGDGVKKRLPSEEKPLHKMSQSVHITKPVSKGDKLTRDNTALKTPADGIPAYKYDNVLGKHILSDMSTADTLEEGDYE